MLTNTLDQWASHAHLDLVPPEIYDKLTEEQQQHVQKLELELQDATAGLIKDAVDGLLIGYWNKLESNEQKKGHEFEEGHSNASAQLRVPARHWRNWQRSPRGCRTRTQNSSATSSKL